MPRIVVFLNKCDVVEDKELQVGRVGGREEGGRVLLKRACAMRALCGGWRRWQGDAGEWAAWMGWTLRLLAVWGRMVMVVPRGCLRWCLSAVVFLFV